MSLRDTPVSAIDLSLQHAEALVRRNAELAALEADIADIAAALEEARMDALRSDPLTRPGGATTEVGQLTRQLDTKLKQRESLLKDIEAQKHILHELEAEAESEKTEAELQAAQAQIADSQEDVATRWTSFVKSARKLRSEWEPLCAAVQQLDALPGGVLPVTPFAGDLIKAFELALRTEDGTDPFKSLSRVWPKRLPIVHSGNTRPQDLTGFGHTMQDTGDYR